VLTHLQPLDNNALRAILTQPKNALIKQYEALFEMDGIDLNFTAQALDYIVEKAVTYQLGARGLRSLCEAILNEAMFELPKTDIKALKITKTYAEEQLSKIELPKLKAVS
jgi:ATP-dependent Clp protease ATP-binding subunit ClpX